MGRLHCEAAAITHIGPVKSVNEDNYYVNGKYKSDSTVSTDGLADKKPREQYTYAVCDGTGGESYGELASLVAVATLEKFMSTDIRKMIGRYLKATNEFICDLVTKNKNQKSGSTVALLNIQKDTAIAYNIGNSRVYFCRKGKLFLLTDEHSENIIVDSKTELVGSFPNDTDIIPHTSKEIKLKKGDTFMLCTDGLVESVSDNEIVEILSSERGSATVVVKKLVSAAQENNGKDNVTAIVVKIT